MNEPFRNCLEIYIKDSHIAIMATGKSGEASKYLIQKKDLTDFLESGETGMKLEFDPALTISDKAAQQYREHERNLASNLPKQLETH